MPVSGGSVGIKVSQRHLMSVRFLCCPPVNDLPLSL